MSIFAKICIVTNLILTLALVFLMGTLLAQKADYKARAAEAQLNKLNTDDELLRRRADFQLQVQNLRAHITETVEKTNAAKDKATEAETAAKRWADQNDDLNQEIAALKTEEETKRKILDEQKREVSRLSGEKRTAEQRRSKAQELEREWLQKVQGKEQAIRGINPPWRR